MDKEKIIGLIIEQIDLDIAYLKNTESFNQGLPIGTYNSLSGDSIEDTRYLLREINMLRELIEKIRNI